MTVPPVDVDSLRVDYLSMVWDDVAVKYCVSATTVKKWCKQLDLRLDDKVLASPKRHAWSEADEIKLMELYRNGMLVRDIAEVIGVRECPVKKRIQLLCKRLNIKRGNFRRSGDHADRTHS
jgi:uncharacterized protein YjcR